MKKKFLFLAVTLLIGGTLSRGYAEDVDPGNIKNFEELKTAVGKVGLLPGLKDALNSAQITLGNKEAEYTAAQARTTAAKVEADKASAAVNTANAALTVAKAASDKAKVDADAASLAASAALTAYNSQVTVVNSLQATIDELTRKIKNDHYTSEMIKTRSPQADLMINFSQALMNRLLDEPTGFTDSELAGMKLFYRIKRTPPSTYAMYVTTAEVAEKQPDEQWSSVSADIDLEEIPRIKFNDAAVKKVNLYTSYLNDAGTVVNTGKITTVISEAESDDEGGALYFSELLFGFEDCANALPVKETYREHPQYGDWVENLAAARKQMDGYTGDDGKAVEGEQPKLDRLNAERERLDGLLKTAQTAVDDAQKAVTDAQADVETSNSASLEAQNALQTAVTEETTAQGEVTTARTAVTNAENAIKEVEPYKNLTINGDVTVTETLGTWPSDCMIRGNGHAITVTSSAPYLFEQLDGSIHELVCENGRISGLRNKDARVTSTIVLNESAEVGYSIFDKDGTMGAAATFLEALYKLRGTYGYDFDSKAENKVVKLDAENQEYKLYHAKYANASGKDIYELYVNFGGDEIKYDKGRAETAGRLPNGITRENAVIYFDDMDVPTDVADWTNVAVRNNANAETYTCSNAALTAGAGTSEFYVPFDFTAKNLSFEKSAVRTAQWDKIPVCLPFKLDGGVKKVIAGNLNTSVENVFYYTFKEVKGTSIWFTPVSEIDANEPCIIAFKKEVQLSGTTNIFEGLTNDMNVTIASTKDATLAATALNNGELCFFGNYKPGQRASELAKAFAGNGSAVYAYGYQNGQLVRMIENDDKTEGSKLHQFRCFVLLAEDLTSSSATPNSLNIGFLDEEGNEVTAISSVESGSDNDFKVVGGNGVIKISADKACDVKVYTVGGSLVKATRVEAGNTTLSLSAGVYVVNQNKVVVK